MNKPRTILLADPSPVIRKGMEAVLRQLKDFEFSFHEMSPSELLSGKMPDWKPDLAILNPSFTGESDLAALRKEWGDSTQIVALICNLADESQQNKYDAAIHLYDDPEHIAEKIRALLDMTHDAGKEEGEQHVLSAREKDIVICVVKGMTNKEIAEHLFISTHTVITHRRNIAQKLQIRSASGLTIYAIVNKLVELDEIRHLLTPSE